MSYESSDILGGPSLNNIKGNDASTGNVFKISSFVALGLVAWLAWFRGRVVFLKWKETRYKKAMRRRHGIPDEDERPFNVAYAAAVRAREREDKGSSAPGGGGIKSRNALAEGQEGLRQRFNDIGAPQPEPVPHWQNVNKPIIPQIAQAYAQIKQQEQNERADSLDFDSRYAPNTPLEINDYAQTSRPAPPRQSSKQHFDPIRKRSFDDDEEDDDDYEPTKKSRVEGEELIDGDEDAEWAYSRTHPHQQQRGSKRGLGMDESDEGYESHRGDKRRRNVSGSGSNSHIPDEDHVMDSDGDEVSELRDIPRGKKRDRAEAGSTFGGDDEENEIEVGADGKASRRRRKRKMVAKRKSEAYAAQLRGRKRDRDVSDESDEEDEDFKYSKKNSRTKRGKQDQQEEEISDDSMNGSLVSRGSYVKGRKIGEEWEVNGVLYKVGVNGQRLRQALVKRARHRFPMPKDSQHPDRQANLEVFVEAWLTEAEYKEAKEGHQLAWQDSPQQSIEPETPGSSQESPMVKGKNLLWASTAGPAQDANSPLPKRRPFRESIATTVGLRINAFPEAQAGRRVASAYNPLPPSAGGDSPTARKGNFRRTFSKWEKQDLEAEAMARMRAKSQGSQKLDVPAGLSAPPLVSSASAPGPSTTPSNGFAFPKAGEKDKAPVAPSLSFGDAPKQAEQSKPPSLFPMPPASTTAKTEEKKPALTSTKTAPSGALFGSAGLMYQPAQAEPSKPTPASTSGSSVPNFFTNKGPTTTPTPQPATENKAQSFNFPTPASAPAPAPSSFSFSAKPATSSVFGNGTQPDQKKEEPVKPASSSNPLLGRMGGFAPPAAASAQPPASNSTPASSPFAFGKTSAPTGDSAKTTSAFGSTPSANSQSTVKSTSAFGTTSNNPTTQPTSAFGSTTSTNNGSTAKPLSAFGSTEQTKSTSAFGNTSSAFGGTPSAPSQNGASTAAPTSSAAPAPKFNFGFSSKPTSSSPSPAPAASSGTTAETKPSSSAFGFDANKSTAPSPSPAPSSTIANAAPKFKFNVPSGGPTFGSPSPLGGAASAGASSTAPKTGFGGFGASTGSSNAFGSTTPAASPSTGTKTFGFGANTASDKPADAPKSYAWPSASSTSNGAQSSTFSFGANKSSSTTNNSTAPSPFGAPTSTTPASNGAQPIFGQTSSTTPSAFGFGSNASSGTGAFGGFGQKQEEKK